MGRKITKDVEALNFLRGGIGIFLDGKYVPPEEMSPEFARSIAAKLSDEEISALCPLVRDEEIIRREMTLHGSHSSSGGYASFQSIPMPSGRILALATYEPAKWDGDEENIHFVLGVYQDHKWFYCRNTNVKHSFKFECVEEKFSPTEEELAFIKANYPEHVEYVP